MTKPLTGRTVLLWLIFFFGVVAAVDGSFMYVAQRSFPGLSTEHAYENGLAYNRILAAAEAQRALGWSVLANADTDGTLTVSVSDRNGMAVESRRVVAEVRRPAESAEDRSVALEQTAPGVFIARRALAGAGIWDVRVRIRRDDGADYVLDRRLTVSP